MSNHTPGQDKPLHPFCKKCGWRQGGHDSWDGAACKCGTWAPAIKRVEAVVLPLDEGRRVPPHGSGDLGTGRAKKHVFVYVKEGSDEMRCASCGAPSDDVDTPCSGAW